MKNRSAAPTTATLLAKKKTFAPIQTQMTPRQALAGDLGGRAAPCAEEHPGLPRGADAAGAFHRLPHRVGAAPAPMRVPDLGQRAAAPLCPAKAAVSNAGSVAARVGVSAASAALSTL